jgi:hypothetical protein
MAERFSDRHGYRGETQVISVREDALENLRYAIPLIAQDMGMTPSVIRRLVCQVLLVPPDRNNWSEYRLHGFCDGHWQCVLFEQFIRNRHIVIATGNK